MILNNAQLRPERLIVFLLLLFFVSGATALAYQVLWMRRLVLVFGTSTFAISTLLATFMGGLAAGGIFAARYADTIRRPLTIYAWLEIGIGLYALLFPLLVSALTPVYLGIWRATTPGPVTFGLVQFVLVGALLLPPTAAMGATLPLLARFATHRLGAAGGRVGTLYGVNTIGAVAGIWLVGFLLLPYLGLLRTTFLAALANLLVGAAALLIQRQVDPADLTLIDDVNDAEPERSVQLAVCIAIGLAGFSALAYEVSWTRLLALILGSSAYVFAIILIAFLTGIALGSKLGGPLADTVLGRYGRNTVMRTFAAIEVGIAVLAWATMYVYAEMPFWYVELFDHLEGATEQTSIWWLSLILAGLIMTPAAILMGIRFPLAVRAIVGSGSTIGKPVGLIYGANSFGAACGAFVAGFVLLPQVGLQNTVVVAALIGLIAAGLLLLKSYGTAPLRRLALLPVTLTAIAVLIITQRPSWDPLLMTAGMYHYVARFDDHSREGIRRQSVDLYDLVYYEEGLSSVVTVGQYKGFPYRWLAINGKVDASTAEDMPTQLLLALLPMQFTNEPDEALVIGLASGITAGTVAEFPGLNHLEIVELEPAIGRAARYFDEWNHAVLANPRAELVYNDARNHILLAEPGTFDIVISEPSNPWISGIANLFTLEFFEIGKSRLKEGGIWSQWVPIYGMDDRDLRSVLQTFATVFSNVLVYSTIEYNDLVLIGSDAPLSPTYSASRQIFDVPPLAAELYRAGIGTPTDLLALYIMDATGIAEMSGGVPLNTDDNLFVEYSTSRKLHVDARLENFAMLSDFAQIPDEAFEPGMERWADLARSYRRRGDSRRAEAAMMMAETR